MRYDLTNRSHAVAIATLLGLVLANTAAYAELYVMTDYPVPAGSRPHDVAPAPDGRVWYTAQNAGALGWLDPVTGQTDHIPLGAGSRPHGVIVGPDGAPWITDGGLNSIVRVDPVTEYVTRYPLPANRPNSNLNTATFDNNGVLWFTGQNGVYGRLNPMNGVMDVYSASRGPGPYGITTTPSGDVYYASLAGDYVGKIDLATGAATVLSPPTPNQGARRVWSDSQGQIWVSEWDAGQVARYNPTNGQWREWPLPGPNPSAYAVYVDDQDIVWLSDFGGNSLVRFDPVSEEFDPFPLPSSPSNVRQILGRPGEVWGAESAADQLVVIRILPDELPGDYNQDGTVDAADYVVWRSTLDQTGTDLAADGNDNGAVDAADYQVWGANFGRAVGGSSAAADLADNVSVPEPHSLCLLSLAVLIVISRRIRSGQ
jgi:virginiamycin B lyase